jgi:hypothetical protein
MLHNSGIDPDLTNENLQPVAPRLASSACWQNQADCRHDGEDAHNRDAHGQTFPVQCNPSSMCSKGNERSYKNHGPVKP